MESAQRFVLHHRRLLAAIAAGLAVLATVQAFSSSPSTTSVVVAAHDLESGAVLTAGDLDTRDLPVAAVPSAHVADPTEVIGHQLSGAVVAGELLTAVRTVEALAVTEGRVRTAVNVSSSTATMLRVGDTVDVWLVESSTVIGSDQEATKIATSAVVLAVASPEESALAAVSIEVDENAAVQIALSGPGATFAVMQSS